MRTGGAAGRYGGRFFVLAAPVLVGLAAFVTTAAGPATAGRPPADTLSRRTRRCTPPRPGPETTPRRWRRPCPSWRGTCRPAAGARGAPARPLPDLRPLARTPSPLPGEPLRSRPLEPRLQELQGAVPAQPGRRGPHQRPDARLLRGGEEEAGRGGEGSLLLDDRLRPAAERWPPRVGSGPVLRLVPLGPGLRRQPGAPRRAGARIVSSASGRRRDSSA